MKASISSPSSHRWRLAGVLLLVLTVATPCAWAGMPSYSLTDLARVRLEVISFFLACLLLLGWGFKVAWNVLAREVGTLPRLRYRGALGLMVVACVLLGLVLTMITGARELMTPGAWVKVGATHQLESANLAPKQWIGETRRLGLQRVHQELLAYAVANGGRLPPDRFADGVDPWIWRVPGPQPGIYSYRPPPFSADPDDANLQTWLLAWEPDMFGGTRLVLRGDGSTAEMPAGELRRLLWQQDQEGHELARRQAASPSPAAAGAAGDGGAGPATATAAAGASAETPP